MVSGQFVLARATISWKSIRFTYTAAELKRPVMRVDVLPSQPTHSIEILPNYLFPGQTQPVKLIFRAGSDIINSGSIKFACSPGLLLLPPGEDSENQTAWASSFEAPLPECSEGTSVDMTLIVRSSGVDKSLSGVESTSLHTSVRTWYRPPFPKGASVSPEDKVYAKEKLFENQLKSSVTTLNLQSLTIAHAELLPYSLDRTLLQIAVQSNCPAPLLICSWDVCLPAFLRLSEDLNERLRNVRVSHGEILYFSLDCSFSISSSPGSSAAPRLLVDVKDESGYRFQEHLAIHLRRPASVDRCLLPRPAKVVDVVIESSRTEGYVGQPIVLTITIDARELRMMDLPIQYRISCNLFDWIICGRTHALITNQLSFQDSASTQLQVVAIPTRPGEIRDYPTLSLLYCHTTGTDRSYAAVEGVNVVHPSAPFLCRALNVNSTVARSPGAGVRCLER
jgi:hypothetical protein